VQANREAESPKRMKRHSIEWRFMSLRWSLASQQIMGGGYFHRAFHRLSRPVYRFVGGCSCRASVVFAGWPGFFQQPVHHWHPLISNRRAVFNYVCFH
jgi:hypothetical protein